LYPSGDGIPKLHLMFSFVVCPLRIPITVTGCPSSVAMPPMMAESGVIRNYVETLLALPWGIYGKDNFDLKHAEKVLNKDHYGLEKVKERILEYLAVRALTKSGKGPILCLVGPPRPSQTPNPPPPAAPISAQCRAALFTACKPAAL